ncbi:MAG: ATP-binding cassette domain-containing protein [Candidatus Gastranaerophilales bacterium]|nr:ATP-binding cassette domain-containing protein [Candidatus Gastranaerophilales bacterium]
MKLNEIKTNDAFNYGYLLKRIFPYIKPLLFRIAITFALAIPLGLLDGVTAFVLKPYIDVVVNGQTIDWHGYILTRDLLAKIIPPGIVIFAGVQGILRYLNTYLSDWISLTIVNSVKIDLFKKLVYLDSKFYDDNSSGLVISRFLSDPDNASRSLIHSIKTLITSFTSALGLIFVLLYNSWELAFVGVIVLICAFVPMALLRKKIKQVSNKTTVVGGNITTSFNETYKGNKVISGYNLQESTYIKIKTLIRETFDLHMSLTKRTGWLSPIMYIIASCGIAVVMFVGNELIATDRLTTGSFASFITSLLLLYKPVKTLGNDLTNIQNVFVAINRVFDLFDFNSRIEDKGQKELNFIPQNIEFKNIKFSYDNSKEILKGISFSARRGQTIAIVGNSGGGKSTIVNLLPRFYDVNEGGIFFDCINIKDFSLNSLRNSISQVFQNNFLFSGTIKENILIGNKNATQEELDKVLKAAHLDEFISTLKNGIDTDVAENGVSLSGGQQQRIAIARAMIKNAPIVVLDEATSALDNKSEKVVQKALDNLMQDRTVFVIAHRLSTIFNADKIIVVDNGQIVEMGTHEELINISDGKYRNLYNMQFKNQEEILENV